MPLHKLFALALLIGIAGLVFMPATIFVWRVMETWTQSNTDQLLGGLMAACGGSLAILAALIGAGVCARLVQGRVSRQPQEPTVIDAPTWKTSPAPQPPPWGVTGGGSFALLPPAATQDSRFQMDVPVRNEPGKRR